MREPPGSRFVRRYEQKRDAGMLERCGWTVAGFAFILAGLVMLVTPGPGLLALGFGLTCLAQESLALARWCDRFEMRMRALFARWRSKR